MPGVTGLRKIQWGFESTSGDNVAATSLARFNGVWEDQREMVFPDVKEGYLGGRNRSFQPSVLAYMTMDGPATFEQLPYIMEMCVKTVTPTTDSGSGTGYIYTYAMPTTAQNTTKTMTIEAGDDQAMEEANYCYVRDFELSGAFGEVWNLSASVYGRQVIDTDSFTASTDITVTTVESMLFQKSKLYIDADSDTVGTTQKTNTLLRASLKVKGGKIHQHTGDGNLYFSFTKGTEPEVTLEVTFEHDGTATAEKTNWRNQTNRLVQLKVEGAALSVAGAYTYKTFIANLAGKWESFDALDSINGNDVVKGVLRCKYNSTPDLFATFIIVNELTTLP